MDKCPVCGSSRVHRSRARTPFERARRLFTAKLPYRCHACGWRRWVEVEIRQPVIDDAADPVVAHSTHKEHPITAEELDDLEPSK